MKRPLLFLLLSSLVLFVGCSHSKTSKAPKPPKENSATASQVEEEFKQRWIEKRGAELMALGLRPDLARQQAIDEFNDRYSFTHAAGK